MDPLSIIGVTAAIQQILQAVYAYGSSVREAKTEINQLCSELLALKAALEHVQLNSNFDQLSTGMENLGLSKDAQKILSSSNFSTPEFEEMLRATDAIMKDLLSRLQQKPGKLNAAMRRVTWHLVKDDLKRDIDRLNRLKSWFILATTSDNTVLCRESYVKISAIDLRLQNQDIRQERKQSSKLRSAVERWLAPYDPHSFHEKSLEAFHEGTGKWFLDDVFQGWLGSDSPILWLRARPGSGKTTLMSAAIEYTRERAILLLNSTALAFFYCSFTDKDSQDLKNVFGSLLVQLCEANSEVWGDLEDQYSKRKGPSGQEPKQMEIEALQRLIIQCSTCSPETILFLDALNESKQLSQILRNLVALTLDGSNTRIVISTTEEVVPTLVPDPVTVVSMGPEDIARDVTKVVDSRLEADERLCDLPAALKSDIKRTLQKGSDGMFRWAQCQLETLSDQNTIQEIRSSLRNVPRTLEQTYHAILARIPQHQATLAQQALFWIAFALKPMELKELSEAIIIGDHSAVIHEDMRLLRDDVLLKSCSNLISYNATTTCVTLAHSSVFTYLTSPEIKASDNNNVSSFHLDESTAFNSVARRCINYMLLPAFDSGASDDFDSLSRRLTDWPLLRYVAEALFAHLYYITLDDAMAALLLRFFATHHANPSGGGGNFGAWVQACFPNASSNIEDSAPLYYAARYGLLGIVRMILGTEEGKRSLELPGGVYRSTPLHVAAWQGRTEVVRELLAAGANAREVNDEGNPGLLWAVVLGYKDVERMLREAGADLDEELLAWYRKSARDAEGWEVCDACGEEEEEEL